MFKKDDEGNYAFSSRFWAQAIILGLLICAIGFSTQRTANRTEQLSQDTVTYAEQTNDCLKQLLEAVKARAEFTTQLDILIDARASVVDRRAAVWLEFINDIAKISTDLPQSERDRLSRPIIDKFMAASAQIEAENTKINNDRKAALTARAMRAYPDPSCGDKLPR